MGAAPDGVQPPDQAYIDTNKFAAPVSMSSVTIVQALWRFRRQRPLPVTRCSVRAECAEEVYAEFCDADSVFL